MTDIIIQDTIETINVTDYTDIISVSGDVSFTLQDVSESINVTLTDNTTFVNIEDVSEIINAVPSEEIISVDSTVEVLDFTSSEPVLITTYNDTYNIDTTATIAVAGEFINGHRIVTRMIGSIYHADRETPSHQSQVLGMSLNAGNISDSINIITMGYVNEPSWSWTPDKPLFLNNDGQMTEIPPTSGFLIQVAQSISSTEVWIDTNK